MSAGERAILEKENKMKSLVIYYSFEGNTRRIATAIAGAVGADSLELKTVDTAEPKGFMKFIWGGKQVMSGKMPELKPLEKNPADYDLLFIGTPVWAWTYTPALKTFFNNVKIEGRKIGLFCCHGGGKGKVLAKMREALNGNEILGEIDFVEPLRSKADEKARQAAEWAKGIVRQNEG